MCEGKHRIELRQCPRKLYGNGETLVCLAAQFLENGLLPTGFEGWTELPAKLVDAIALVTAEREYIRKHGGASDRED